MAVPIMSISPLPLQNQCSVVSSDQKHTQMFQVQLGSAPVTECVWMVTIEQRREGKRDVLV